MIILFGVVGSGKSEQAKRLITKLGCPHISTSRLIRNAADPNWEAIMLMGKLLPDSDIISLLEPELAKIGADRNEFILDGAPRSIGQAQWLYNQVQAGKIKLTAIIYLKVSKETTIQRLMARGRDDDKREIISERFRQYEEVTLPVLEYFKSQGWTIYEVDGEGSVDEVEKEIWQILKDKVSAPQIR
jgi:adenylate kinase